jgi:hypothetical protein
VPRRSSSLDDAFDDALRWLARTTRKMRTARSTPKPIVRMVVRRRVYRAQRKAARNLLRRIGL